MAGEPVWRDLGPAQADGLACVVCGCDYLAERVQRVPVGRSQTGSQVFACVGECAGRAEPWPPLEIPEEALTVAGMAFLAAWGPAVAATPTGDPRHAYPDEVVAATVEAAAPLIVACELRRLAEWVGDDVASYQTLRDRANQLDRR